MDQKDQKIKAGALKLGDIILTDDRKESFLVRQITNEDNKIVVIASSEQKGVASILRFDPEDIIIIK